MKRVLSALLALTLLLGVVLATSSVSAAETILYGDVNGDGKVNNRDLGLLQRYLNEDTTVTVNAEAADVKYDGKVNNRDLGLLQQYLNDYPVHLGPEKPAEPEVPPAELPPVGYDIDGRGRVIVDAISQDGYTVTFSLRNHSNKWMTEETSCFLYTCTDAEGNVLVLNDKYYGTLYIGMLEANDVDTYTITLPEGTAKLEFGDSRIVYWSQWA